jgi:O-antigen biosynthesis protein
VRVSGKLFRAGEQDWYLKGFTYGPFRPNVENQHVPEPDQLRADLGDMQRLGCTAIRLYHPPTIDFLDLALQHDIRVMIDVPWEKHRCFFEDWSSQQDAIDRVRHTAQALGRHPGVYAISVANEIPHDIVRFYGTRRVEQFIEHLVETAKAEAPDCLVTYTNYPSTEFLAPRNLDFYCTNVYLNDGRTLRQYLDRLQHVAGNLPLILGEYGMDTIREGEARQDEALRSHLLETFRRGLAGSFVFSYTDEWFTGGQEINDWAFGVTRRDRSHKRAAQSVSWVWAQVPRLGGSRLPKVSVVVCSYNGAKTLHECLASLQVLDYPDYEVILIDDGSTDDTSAIAAQFPGVRYIHQTNQGLSAARNVGAQLATGEIIAYTDSDCAADPHWLLYLAQAMEDQGVQAVGGPNISPPSDGWIAKCVAASPGGPSHVMLDDRCAEHVPGCNMAFRRDTLLTLGGFDVQFRQAGDDVDICWRFLDAGMSIGYAPSALLWHHRRNTVRAYWKQQAGYGRSEAMLQLKHPQRFNRLGYSQWCGVIYGDGAVGLPILTPTVYHGQFGNGLFQIIYRRNDYSLFAYCTLFEWHVLALMMLVMSVMWPAAVAIPAAMWSMTLVAALRQIRGIDLPKGAPRWCRPLIFALCVSQPIVRGWHRFKYRLRATGIPHIEPAANDEAREERACMKNISWLRHDLYFTSNQALGREHLLAALVKNAKSYRWPGDFSAEWEAHDVELYGDRWFNIRLHTATEELGWPDRYTRVRCSLRFSGHAAAIFGFMMLWTILTAVHMHAHAWWPVIPAALGSIAVGWMLLSRHRCRRAVSRLVYLSGKAAGLCPAKLWLGAAKAKQTEQRAGLLDEEAEPCLS